MIFAVNVKSNTFDKTTEKWKSGEEILYINAKNQKHALKKGKKQVEDQKKVDEFTLSIMNV